MIIDAHGHYTTAPPAHWEFRRKLLEAQDDPARIRSLTPARISDDEIRESVAGAQLRLQRERGTDLTIFSPQASGMAHHEGGPLTSAVWSAACNDLISRVCGLYPDHFVGVCWLPQSPGVGPRT
jgi:4-oxalmesaconate hydratase